MADLNPIICTALVTNGSDEIEVTGTDAATGEAVLLTDFNVRPGIAVMLGGVGYTVRGRLTESTFRVWRDYEGVTNTDPGVSCEIQPFSPEAFSRATLVRELREVNAQTLLVDARGFGAMYQVSGTVGLANPGPGKVGRDNADWSAVANLCISALDASSDSVSQASKLERLGAGTDLYIEDLTTGGYHHYTLTGAPVSQEAGAWYQLAAPIYRGSALTVADGVTARVTWSGAQGAAYEVDAEVDDPSGLAAYEEEDPGYKVFVRDLEDDFGAEYDGRGGVVELVAGPAWEPRAVYTGPKGDQGDKGWAPVLASVVDGARRVKQLVGYVGGEGTEPTDNVGEYVGPAGYVATAAEATDDRGPPGSDGLMTSVVAGPGIAVDVSDPANPVVGLDNMAEGTIKGRAAGAGTGAPADLTPAQVRAITQAPGRVAVAKVTLSNQTAVAFSDIPATCFKIEIMIAGLSTNGTSVPRLYLNKAGGSETSGYVGSEINITNAAATSGSNHGTGFPLSSGWGASTTISGKLMIDLQDAATNTWVLSGFLGGSNAIFGVAVGGHVPMSGTLTGLTFAPTNFPTDQFDAGSISIAYHFT